MAKTTIMTTQIQSDSDDFDIRREFCGVQDKRLNDLRHLTSCIIDLQTHGAKDPFEKVTWVISHYDEAVRAFVVKRIQAWAKTTQIAVRMHIEDIAFHQQILSDSSSGSMDGKVQQLGDSVKSSPSPPRSSVPLMSKKNSKTPLRDYRYGSVSNAALVPQTDIHSRYQQRPRRNSSSSGSDIRRPALFGKPSDNFLSKRYEYPRNRYSPLSTPITKTKLFNENELFLAQPPALQIKHEHSFEMDREQNKESNTNNENWDQAYLEDDATFAHHLSDTSDFESDCRPLMADIILISQLRECLIKCPVPSTDNIDRIQSLITKPLSVSGTAQLKTFSNKPFWHYRLLLNSKIILSNGIHQSKEQAQKIAYAKMMKLITNKQGVEPKIVANGRCKVVLRASIPVKQFNETTNLDAIITNNIDAY